MKTKLAIIGGGYTGLCCAKKLIDNDFDVTIYEETDKVGGMAKCIDHNGIKIEKHYRHIFKSDQYVIDLLNEFNLLNELQWEKTKMAYYSNDGLYEFGTPISLLKYKPLTLIEKIRFGMSIIKIKLIKNYKKIEKYTAEEWIIKNCGKAVYEKIWEPLLISKFGNKKDEVSMSWLWGKINLRSSSSAADGERLGYLDGSFEKLTIELEKYLKKNNCDIKTNESVTKVHKEGSKYLVKTNHNESEFDYVVSTVSYNITQSIFEGLLTEEELKRMTAVNYVCAKTLLIFSKKSLTPFYWINIGNKEFPFGGIIEHTNMIDKSKYNDINLIYISNYIDKNDSLYKLNAKELFAEYDRYLKRLNQDFQANDVIDLLCFEENDAQPIIQTNYSNKILNTNLKEKGLFVANMAQIYPEDRGMNYAIKIGYEVAEQIIKLKL